MVSSAVINKCNGQSIGYGMPNFGLMYNPYTSPAWGYGLGPQFSTVRGSLASGMLFGGHPGIASLGGFGNGPLPYGPYSSYAFPGLSSSGYHVLGPYGRYPGSTGTMGYGSYQGYNVYTGMGSYPGVGPFGAFAPGDYDHYRNDQPKQSDLASFGLNPSSGMSGPMPMASSRDTSSPSSSYPSPASLQQQQQQQQTSSMYSPQQSSYPDSMAQHGSMSNHGAFASAMGQQAQQAQQMQQQSLFQGNSASGGLPGGFRLPNANPFASMPPAYAPPVSSNSNGNSGNGNSYQMDSLASMFAIPIGGRPDRADSRKMLLSEEETAASSGIRETIGSPSSVA